MLMSILLSVLGAHRQTQICKMVAVARMPTAFVRLTNPMAVCRSLADQLYAALSPTKTVMSRLLRLCSREPISSVWITNELQ